jgi:hypothetical protein
VSAIKVNDRWTYITLELAVEGQEARINLLEGSQ